MPRLTPTEKQDVIRFLEADKPLPDKYRFLLFDDKREVELVWLGFEFEMGLFPNVLDEAKAKGIDIQAKYIPAEVFDKRAVEKDQVVFHDVAAIEVRPIVKGNFGNDTMTIVDVSVKR